MVGFSRSFFSTVDAFVLSSFTSVSLMILTTFGTTRLIRSRTFLIVVTETLTVIAPLHMKSFVYLTGLYTNGDLVFVI